ncbi:MAG: hypothetical protein LBK76_04425 [Verrucomicrobiales bacterium]|jgi:hypothetical protein|nr:hypothetical protein [Verrucomicrobiales bacterium]
MEDNKSFFTHLIAYFILAAAFVLLVGWQLIMSVGAHSNLQTALKARVEAVSKAQDAQRNLENFVNDLIELAKTNDGAKTIVDKYQIRKSGNTQ